ncbi:MAG: phosphomannomutase/phosphoglucomutase [Clostridia bacterium]|nr:phosphomannomutase/phosphoglucomutase [Clostridia bacterium]
MSLQRFKSGTDIRGYAAEEFADNELYISDEFVKKVSVSFAKWLSEKQNKPISELTVSVGRDSRLSGPRIRDAAEAALSSLGVCVKDCGLASTPAMFMSVVDLPCDGAIQITASHHPSERNGLKFFTRSGGLGGEDISAVLDGAETESAQLTADAAKISSVDFMSKYAEMLRNMIKSEVNAENYDRPLDGLKIAVDAGNGVGGFYAEEVLKPLGADTSGSRFLEPDGSFPNHIPNPENSQAMGFIGEATVKSGADLGIIFDTDVDRAGCVDRDGTEINRNRLVALASYIALNGKNGGTIVTDSVTSSGLGDYIEKLGGIHYRYKRGYRNVINKQIELNEQGEFCPLAMETSGHAAFKDNYYLDDGAYLVTKIVILLAKDKTGEAIGKILAPLKMPCEEKELRFRINRSDFRVYGEKIIEDMGDYFGKLDGWRVADDNREGMRVYADREHGDGWIMIRVSVHDPVMPFNAESNSDGIKTMLESFYKFISKYDGIDISPLKEII